VESKPVEPVIPLVKQELTAPPVKPVVADLKGQSSGGKYSRFTRPWSDYPDDPDTESDGEGKGGAAPDRVNPTAGGAKPPDPTPESSKGPSPLLEEKLRAISKVGAYQAAVEPLLVPRPGIALSSNERFIPVRAGGRFRLRKGTIPAPPRPGRQGPKAPDPNSKRQQRLRQAESKAPPVAKASPTGWVENPSSLQKNIFAVAAARRRLPPSNAWAKPMRKNSPS